MLISLQSDCLTSDVVKIFLFHESFLDFEINTYFLFKPLGHSKKITLHLIRLDEFIADHCLKAGMQCNEKRWFVAQSQHTFLHQNAVNIIILNHDFLLQNFDGIQLVSALAFSKQHLPTTINTTHNRASTASKYHTFNTRSIRYSVLYLSPAFITDW